MASAAPIVDDTEWRTSVKQSYRNAQVRQAAKVLASVEPGATEASKLRLAMQFEDSIFTVATSLSDYHKKLTKRLNKLQKTYVPSAANDTSLDSHQKKKEKTIQGLIATYGKDVKYITENAVAAVKEMREKYGEEKAVQLQQHTDSVKLWAIDLGIIPESEGAVPKPNMTMSDTHLERLVNHLDKRLSNIRAHVVKLVHPDQFLQESLQRIQDEFKDKGRVVRIQADNMRKRYDQLQQVIASQHQPSSVTTVATIGNDTFDPNKLMIQALEQALKPVPSTGGTSAGTTNQQRSVHSDSPLKKSNNTTQQRQQQQAEWEIRKQNALLHLEKMRAASTILVAYLCIPDKYTVPQPNVLAQAHAVAMEGIEVVQNVMKDLQHAADANINHVSTNEETKRSSATTTLQLHDAWLKPIVIPTKDVVLLETDNLASAAATSSSSSSSATTLAPRPAAVVLRTRVLCTTGRKTPSNFIMALQDKGVTLVRPPKGATYARLLLEPAFVLQIYFVPLLVIYRAYNPNDDSNMADPNDDASGSHARHWPPLHSGLTNRTGTEELLSVNGIVKGKYETVGWMIQEHLRDASAHATNILRQCFSKTVSSQNEFEIELLEASALLEFVQLARDTYLPKHKDETIV